MKSNATVNLISSVVFSIFLINVPSCIICSSSSDSYFPIFVLLNLIVAFPPWFPISNIFELLRAPPLYFNLSSTI